MSERHPKSWTSEPPAPADAESIACLLAASWRATYVRPGQDERNQRVYEDAAAFLTPDRLAQRREIIANLDADTDYMRIARKVGGRGVIAWLYGYSEPQEQELLALYVDPSFHGSGLAQEMTERFIDWCDPGRPINVGVVHDNNRAREFYGKMGFVATENENEFNDYLTEIIMQRPPEGDIQ